MISMLIIAACPCICKHFYVDKVEPRRVQVMQLVKDRRQSSLVHAHMRTYVRVRVRSIDQKLEGVWLGC